MDGHYLSLAVWRNRAEPKRTVNMPMRSSQEARAVFNVI
jgi:hypothetical protein